MAFLDGITDKLGEISGGDTAGGDSSGTGSTSSSTGTIEQLINGPDGPLAEAFGEHLVRGHLIVTKYDPPSSIVVQAGGTGVWDSVVKAWYAGEEIAVSPDDVTPGYHFYPGTISTGVSDPTQPVDGFLPDGLAYSGTAYVSVLLPEKFSTEDRPDKFVWRAKCKKVWDYDLQGNELNFAYSVNPADIALHAIRNSYEQRYSSDLDLAYRLFRDRVDWASYTDWWNYNAETIEWDNGTTVRDIPRFECHLAFTGEVDLAAALDQITACCGAFWRDDGELYSFTTPAPHDPVHHFHYDPAQRKKSNIVNGSVHVTPTDIRLRPNYLVGKFRNLDNEFLGGVGDDPYSSAVVRRNNLIQRVGIVRSERLLPNMVYSQAQRLLERQLRIEADNPKTYTLRGLGDSFHLLKGDYCTITHPVLGVEYQKCLVLIADPDSAEKSPDDVEFTLLPIKEELYSDTAHTAIQQAIEP